jgi:hypothetical protein
LGRYLNLERTPGPEGDNSRRRLLFMRLPDHERLGVDLSLWESFTFDQSIHLCRRLEAEFMIESQGLGGRLEESLIALLICPITTVPQQHATSTLSLVLHSCSNDLEVWQNSSGIDAARYWYEHGLTPMPTILHQLPVLSCPRAKRFVAQADIRLFWPLRQTEIGKDTRLRFYPFAERRHLAGINVHSFEEV